MANYKERAASACRKVKSLDDITPGYFPDNPVRVWLKSCMGLLETEMIALQEPKTVASIIIRDPEGKFLRIDNLGVNHLFYEMPV